MAASQSNTVLAPVLFIPHGGGPLPLLGHAGHKQVIHFLSNISKTIERPDAVLIVSAHWEENIPTLTSSDKPELIYDYNGFPPESYAIRYSAPGDVQLANDVHKLLTSNQSSATLNPNRGFDHGMFVPLKLMYPNADIPCVQLSLLKGLDATKHIHLGEKLASLRAQNILILGSGLSFHNLPEFFSPTEEGQQHNENFNNWLIHTLCDTTRSTEDIKQKLIDWEQAPGARFCHPREEHLLPLHVCFGAATDSTAQAEVVFNDAIMGKQVSSFLWK